MKKCVWLKWIGGHWKCTFPSNHPPSSEFCGLSDRDDAEAIGRDYCEHYYPEEVKE